MKISPIRLYNPAAFSGKIIDSHTHAGDFMGKTYTTQCLDTFVKSPLKVTIQGRKQQDTVEKMLISNLNAMGGKDLDETEGNLEMLEVCSRNKKFIPIAVCEPQKTLGDASVIRELTANNDFYGLKFHPEANGLRADSVYYDSYLDVAQERGLPCIFHTQVNLNWKPDENNVWRATMVDDKDKWSNSDPEFVYELAKRHPEVPVIMAHTGAGGPLAHQKAIDILCQSIDNNDANLYCDISWMDFQDGLPDKHCEDLIDLISRLKERNALDRILFGTDAPLGCYGEALRGGLSPKEAYEKTISAFKTAIKDNFKKDGNMIIKKIFYDNARELFFNNISD